MHEILSAAIEKVMSGEMQPDRACAIARLSRESLRNVAERRKVLASAQIPMSEDLTRWAKN